MTNTEQKDDKSTHLTAKRQNRWVLKSDFIDPYLVTAIDLPRAQYVGNSIPCVSFSHLQVEVVEPRDTSVYSSALKRLKTGDTQNLELVFLDEVGIEVETWTMTGTVFAVEIPRIAYDSLANPMKTTISFTIKTLDVVTGAA